MTKKTYIRVTIYLLIWIIYLIFMSINSPLGINWLDWHSQRIYNFSEFLNLNGYFNNFGFSIWSKCNDCALESENWTNKIYLSMNIFSYLPYVLTNTLFGDIFLKSHGHLIDKTIIFFTGILISELFLKFNNKNVILDKTFIKSLFIFVFFITNPWTYKMILAHWVHIYFVFFFLLGIYMFLANRKNLGLIFTSIVKGKEKPRLEGIRKEDESSKLWRDYSLYMDFLNEIPTGKNCHFPF